MIGLWLGDFILILTHCMTLGKSFLQNPTSIIFSNNGFGEILFSSDVQEPINNKQTSLQMLGFLIFKNHMTLASSSSCY